MRAALEYGLVGSGVALATYAKAGLGWALTYGLLWPAWLGYHVATRLGG